MQTILRNAEISFPMFGDFHMNPPSSFELFGRTFYLYGAVVALGFCWASSTARTKASASSASRATRCMTSSCGCCPRRSSARAHIT